MTALIDLLPPEVWSQILLSFSLRELARLCGVHRVFFERVMELKYRHVRIAGRMDIRILRALSNEAVLSRVQSLEMETLTFKPCLSLGYLYESQYNKEMKERLLGRLWSHLRALIADERQTDRSFRFLSLRTVSLSIGSRYWYLRFLSHPVHTTFLATRLWPSATFPALTTLALHLPLEVYRDALVPVNGLHLPALTSLSLGVWCCFVSTDYREIPRGALASFVARHAGRLDHFEVEVQQRFSSRLKAWYFSSYALFEALGEVYFAALQSLSLTEPLLTPSQTDLRVLDGFLARHGRQLKELKLHLPDSLVHRRGEGNGKRGPFVERFREEDVRRGMPLLFPGAAAVPDATTTLPPGGPRLAGETVEEHNALFPNLETLNIAILYDADPNAFPDFQPSSHPTFPKSLVQSFIGRLPQQTRLTTLHLEDALASPSDVLAVLKSTPSLQTSLHDVSIYMPILQPSFLRDIERTLPHLDRLSIRIRDSFMPDSPAWGLSESDDTSSPTPDDRLEVQLRAQVFTDWALNRLAIKVVARMRLGRVVLPEDMPDEEVLREVFPNVRELEHGAFKWWANLKGGGDEALSPYDYIYITIEGLES